MPRQEGYQPGPAAEGEDDNREPQQAGGNQPVTINIPSYEYSSAARDVDHGGDDALLPPLESIGSGGDAGKAKAAGKVSFFALFRYATALDALLIALGVVGAVANGESWLRVLSFVLYFSRSCLPYIILTLSLPP